MLQASACLSLPLSVAVNFPGIIEQIQQKYRVFQKKVAPLFVDLS